MNRSIELGSPNTELDIQLWSEELSIQPIYENYRDLPITEGFDWRNIINEITGQRFVDTSSMYLVVFRSIRKTDVEPGLVERLDEAAHIEAKNSPALLHYFAGEIDENRKAVSWCLWTDKAAARQALSGPAHQEAVRFARKGILYETFAPEFYDVYLDENRAINFVPAPRHQT